MPYSFILVGLHLSLCLIIVILCLLRKSDVIKRLWAVLVIIPIVGFLICLVELKEERKSDQDRAGYQLLLAMREERDSSIDRDDSGVGFIVPVEEALQTADSSVQRKLVYMLLDGMSNENVPLLKKIHAANDTELTHFAATRMVELRRSYERKIFIQSATLKDDPKNREALEAYCRAIEEFLKTGLPTVSEVERYKGRMEKSMRTLVAICPDVPRYQRQYLEILMDKGNLSGGVLKMIGSCLIHWPEDARSYRVLMQYCYLMRDRRKVDSVVQMIRQRNVYLNSEALKWYGFWSEE